MIIKDLKIENKQFTEQKRDEIKHNSKNSQNRINIQKYITTKNLIVLIAIFQLITLLVILNPINLINQHNTIQVFNRVSTLTQVPPQELPVMAVIGDMKTLPKHETLIGANDINFAVYRDAKDGDYVLGYTSKMVIYRAPEDRIIYEGESPAQIQQRAQTNLINQVINKVKERGLIPADSQETPSANLVTNPDLVRQANPNFYNNLLKGDIVAVFNSASLIIIYRPSTNELINFGTVSTIIQ